MTGILTAAQVHGARSPIQLAAIHRTFLREHLHLPGAEHVIADPQVVVINHGRWLFDCTCGSGVMAAPGWPEARCFSCGAVYQALIFPADRAAIEAALMARPALDVRNWQPGETAQDLIAETVARGRGRP